MEKELKKPLSFQEQVLRLKEHGLIIADDAAACDTLSKIDDYRLSGYAYQYRKDSLRYADGITFDQIIKIHDLDQSLRNLLRKPIEVIEIWARTQIAHQFSMAKCALPPHDGHYLSLIHIWLSRWKAWATPR